MEHRFHKRTLLKQFSVWAFCIGLALIMLFAGGMKLFVGAEAHGSFVTLGLPSWFGYIVGTCEVLGAIGVLVPRTRMIAASGLALLMVGAFYYHVVHTPILEALPALVILVVCVALVFDAKRSQQAV